MNGATIAVRAGRLPGRVLVAVGAAQHRDDRPRGREAQRLGLPLRAAVVDPGQGHQVGVAAQHQVGQGAAGDVGGHHAVPGVAAGPAEPGGRVEADAHAPVAGNAQRAAPVVRDRRRLRRRREVAVERAPQPLLDGVVALVLLADRRVQPVGRAAPADRDPAVGRALRVEEQVPEVGDQLARRPSRSGPHVVGQRLGRDHQRVERQEPPALARQLRRVRLGRPQDGARPDGALRAADAAGLQLERLGVLVDDDAEALARRRPARAPAGRDRSAPRAGRSWRPRQPATRTRAVDLVGVQQRVRPPAWAARVGALHALQQAPALRLAGRDEQRAGMVEPAVDALRVGDAADLLDRRVGLPLRPAHRVRAAAPRVDGALPATPPEAQPPFLPDGP